MDGTLTDAAAATRRAEELAMQASGLPEKLSDSDFGRLVGRSPRSTVYEIGNDLVVKFHALSSTAREVARQVRVSQRVYSTGLPVPWSSERIVRHAGDGRLATISERASGATPKQLLLAKPAAYRRILAGLASNHRSIHQYHGVAGLPSQRERIQRQIVQCIEIPKTHKAGVLEVLQGLPDDDALCHGDFSWSNTIVAPNKRTIIDWTDVGLGSALGDVARTWVLLHFNAVFASPLIGLYSRLLSRSYLKSYFGRRLPPEFRGWAVVNAALRLRDLPEERYKLTREKLRIFLDRELARNGYPIRQVWRRRWGQARHYR